MRRHYLAVLALVALLAGFSARHALPAHAATSTATTAGYTVQETGPDLLTAGVPATYTVTFTTLLPVGLIVTPTVAISAGASAITITNSTTYLAPCIPFMQATSPVNYSSSGSCVLLSILDPILQPTITLTITLTPTAGAGSITVSAAEPINSAGTLVSLTTPLAVPNTSNFPALNFRPLTPGVNFDPRCSFGCPPGGLP